MFEQDIKEDLLYLMLYVGVTVLSLVASAPMDSSLSGLRHIEPSVVYAAPLPHVC